MKISLRIMLAVAMLIVGVAVSCVQQATDRPVDIKSRLMAAQRGVWLSGSGTYTIWTDDHYFVVSFTGDTSSPNLYCAGSQVVFHDKGVARKQNIRLRQFPGGEMSAWRDNFVDNSNAEKPLVVDTSLFTPGTCNVVDGVIYDAVTEVSDDYILLATCNGDHIKLFDDGRMAYLPVSGGEFLSWRVEEF